MTANRFDQLIDQWELRLKRAFLDAVKEIRDGAQVAKIAELLEKGDVDGAVRAVGLDPTQFRIFDKSFQDAYEAGGVYTSNGLPPMRDGQGLRLKFQFNIRNFAAEAWLRSYSAQLVSSIFDDQRAIIRGVLERGMSAGINPRSVALDLIGRIGQSGAREGGLIGLTDSQVGWVEAYEAELRSDKPTAALQRQLRDRRFDRTVEQAAREGCKLTESEIGPMVRAYRNRALRYRAETIARSEAITALHQGQQHALDQAVASGGLKADALTMTWRSARDRRVRDAHRHLNGKSVQRGGAFQSDLGPIRFPGDPQASAANTINCRCWLEPSVDFLAGIR